MDILTYNIQRLSEERVCVEVGYRGVTLGILYFEKPKRIWVRKPILPTRWSCVDATIEGLYVYEKNGGIEITPKEIISHCQSLIEKL